MKCPNCGEESRDSRINCLKCGSPLHGSSDNGSGPSEGGDNATGLKQAFPQPKARSCPNCGKFNRERAKFCTRCGLLVESPTACPHCQGPIDPDNRYCSACGHVVSMEKLTTRSVRPIAALLFALIPGIFSLWGIGHFFVGRFRKGLMFLVLGLLLMPISALFIIFFAWSLYLDWWVVAILIILSGVVWVGLWLYQSLDAYHEAGGE